MLTRKGAVLVILFVLISVSVSSISAEGIWETHLPIKNADNKKLSPITVAVDHDNVKWFGAIRGVSSFDGINWETYTKANEFIDFGDTITDVAVDHDDAKWFGTQDIGVLVLHDDEWQRYSINDGLAHNHVWGLAVDHNNVMWFATYDGVSSFDGINWETYTAEDGWTGHYTHVIAVDHYNVKWFGNYDGNISSFNGKVWKNYCTDFLGHDGIMCIAVDRNNVKWFGTLNEGVLSFDGTDWKKYATQVDLPYDSVMAVAVDHDNVKWFGTIHGLTSFDGADWTTYTIDNGLPDNNILDIAVDANNVKWILTSGGVYSYDNRVITQIKETADTPQGINIRGNFPNPFNPATTIEFSVDVNSSATLAIYNIAGQKVKTFAGQFTVGNHSIVWNGQNEFGLAVSSGMYFCRITVGNFASSHKMTLAR